MAVFIYAYFELLKESVVKSANLDTITTADCGYLSGVIKARTKKSVSETTLKRLYGFASSRFKPSSFTLDTLAAFCGYKNWEDFCQQNKSGIANPAEPAERDLTERAEGISRTTFEALKNRSGIPYHYTIARRSVQEHLQVFEEGHFTATFIIGASGSGKTIALLHWLADRMPDKRPAGNNDVYLFFSGHLLNVALLHENSLEQWLLNLYGINTQHDLAGYFTQTGQRLYLVIDGLDEHLFKTNQFELILNQLIDIVSGYRDSSWFKLIVTMSSATWMNYPPRNRNFHTQNDHCYVGRLAARDQQDGNMPPFSYEELVELAQKINPQKPAHVALQPDVARILGHPEYFTYFYQANRQNFSLERATSAHLYGLFYTYILDKIYSGRNRVEKMTLIAAITGHMNYRKHLAYVNRSLLQTLIRQNGQAYRELTSQCVIYETNQSSALRYRELLRFGNHHLTRYFLTEQLLISHNYEITQALVQHAQLIIVGDDDALGVLKWTLFHAIAKKEFSVFGYVAALKLHPTEKRSLMTFICDRLNQHFDDLKENAALLRFFKDDFTFFNTFCNLALLDPGYKKSISLLLRFDLPADKVILLRAVLAMGAVAETDLNTAAKHIHAAIHLPADQSKPFPANPADGVMALLAYLKQGLVIYPTPDELLRLPHQLKAAQEKEVFEAGVHIAAHVSTLGSHHEAIAAFAKDIRMTMPGVNGTISTEFNFLLFVMECRAVLFMGDCDRAGDLFNYLTGRYNHLHAFLTDAMHLNFLVLKTQVSICLKKRIDLLAVDREIDRRAQESGLAVYPVLNKTFLLNHQTESWLTPAETSQVSEALDELVHERELQVENFAP